MAGGDEFWITILFGFSFMLYSLIATEAPGILYYDFYEHRYFKS